MNITLVVRLLFGALLLALLGACSSDSASTEQSDDVDQIVVRLSDQPESLSPFMAKSSLSRQVYMYMYNTLADFDYQTSELTPVLIESLPEVTSKEDGGSIYSMRIKEDAVWEDGSPVTGHDVAWTLKMTFHPGVIMPTVSGIYADVEAVNVDPEDPKKFEIRTSNKKFLEKEIMVTCDIYQKSVFDSVGALDPYTIGDFKKGDDLLVQDTKLKKLGEDFSSVAYMKDKATGSGPYRLERYEEGQFIVLRKKDNYWGLAYPDTDQLNQYPDRMIFQIVPDEATALTLLKNKEIDFMDFSRSSIAQYDDLKADSSYANHFEFDRTVIPRFIYVLLNHEDERLSDKEVRKALRHLVDVDRIIEQLVGGYARPQVGPVHISKTHHKSIQNSDGFNPDIAKQILDNAGWIDTDSDGIRDKIINGRMVPLSLTWHITGSAMSTSISTMVMEAGKNVGIDIQIIEKPYRATYTENILTGDFDITVQQKTQSQLMDDLYLTYHSTAIGSGGDNLIRYSNAEVDDIVEMIRETNDPKERSEAYDQVQKILYEDVDAIYLYSPELKFVVNGKINPALSSLRPGYFLNSKEP